MFNKVKNRLYNHIFKKKNVKANQVFVECFYGREFSGDSKELAKKFRELNNYEIYVVYTDNKLASLIVNEGFLPVKLESKEYFKKYYTSKYIISNLNLYKMLEKKVTQKFIQTWHGFPIKNMVKELTNQKQREFQSSEFNKDMQKWDYLLSPSEFYTNELDKSFGLNADLEVVYSIAPRIEFLLENKKEQNSKIILYAPTWKSYESVENTRLDLEKIAQQTGYIIWVKPHVHDKSFEGLYENSVKVIIKSECFNIYDLLIECEILITDISSIMFDYLVLNNKLILHSDDFEKYQSEIGIKYSPSIFGDFEIKKYSEEMIIEKINKNNFQECNDFIKNNVIGKYDYLDLINSKIIKNE